MASDAFWPSTVVALHLDDSPFTDVRGHTVASVGNVVRATVSGAINGYAASFDGYGDAIAVTVSAVSPWEFEPATSGGPNDFCVEARVFVTDTSANRVIASRRTASTDGWTFQINGSMLVFSAMNSGGTTFISTTASDVITINTWHHVAFCYSFSEGISRLFVDGAVVATEFGTSGTYLQNATVTAQLRVGGTALGAGYSFSGYIEEFEITRDAKYTAAFTPLTVAFGEEPAYFTGTVLDSASDPVVATITAHRASDGATAGSVDSISMDGSFSVPAMNTSPHYIVCRSGTENALIFDNVTLA